METIPIFRQDFVDFFAANILAERLSHEIFISRLRQQGIIEANTNTYYGSLANLLWHIHLEYTITTTNRYYNSSPSVITSMPAVDVSNKVYDLFGSEGPIRYNYDKLLNKVEPGDLIVTGSLNVSIYIRNSRGNANRACVKSYPAGKTKYIDRDRMVKINSEYLSNLINNTGPT